MADPPVADAPSPVPSDEDLMNRVQTGDAQAYEELFRRHQGRVYGFLVRRLRDPSAADEVFQDAFMSVFRARHTWQPGRQFRPWLFGIAANAARDHQRRVRRAPDTVELNPRDRPTWPSSATVLDLERAIEALPDSLREAFLLGAVEGFDHRELATQLNISPANARARVSRARKALRSALDPDHEGDA